MIAKDKDGANVDTLVILFTENWLGVLAAPLQYRVLQRAVDPAYLVSLMDTWIAYAERGENYVAQIADPVRDAQRPALARTLRALLAAWTPPGLPAEITATARALLEAEGAVPPWVTEVGWDTYTFESKDRTLESFLSWPETEIWPKEANEAEVEAANMEKR